MVERFGGLKGIAEAWGQSLDQDLGRGGCAAFRHLEAILRLTQYREQNRPDYGAMTDEELERAIGERGGWSEAPRCVSSRHQKKPGCARWAVPATGPT
jgi:hypothetical protein